MNWIIGYSGNRVIDWLIEQSILQSITQLPDYPVTQFEKHVMADKTEKTGVVISNKMQKSIVVAVEWQVRHGLYGKTERRTSTFMVQPFHLYPTLALNCAYAGKISFCAKPDCTAEL